MESIIIEGSSSPNPSGEANSSTALTKNWQQQLMLDSKNLQPHSGNRSARQKPHRMPRQSMHAQYSQQWQPRTTDSTTNDHSRDVPSNQSQSNTCSNSHVHVNGHSRPAEDSSDTNQQQASVHGAGRPGQRNSQTPGEQMQHPAATSRSNRAPRRPPQGPHQYQNITHNFGPPLGPGGTWQQTMIRLVDGRMQPAVLPNGHIRTDPAQNWMRFDNDGPSGRFTAVPAGPHPIVGHYCSQSAPPPHAMQSMLGSIGPSRGVNISHPPHMQHNSGSFQGPSGSRYAEISPSSQHGSNGGSVQVPARLQQHSMRQSSRSRGVQSLATVQSPGRHHQSEANGRSSQQPRPPPQRLPPQQVRRPAQKPLPETRRLRGLRPGQQQQNGSAEASGSNLTDETVHRSAAGQGEDVHSCVICTGPLSIVAVGQCNHKEICARCSLLMRLNYGDTACPFCKTELPQVILTRWKSEGIPDFSELQSRSKAMWRRPAWAPGVLVDNATSPAGPPLNSIVQGITAMACPLCDEAGARPFRSSKLLQAHATVEHGRSFCDVCLAAKRRFPLELDAFTKDELAAHLAEEHPRCEFCTVHMYSSDELYEHMLALHFTCDICQRLGTFMHFVSPDHLTAHLRSDHHLCEEPECAGLLAAFGSAEELAQHRRERHSRAMPRFDRSRARPLPLGDAAFPMRYSRPAAPASPNRSRSQEQQPSRGRQPRSRQPPPGATQVTAANSAGGSGEPSGGGAGAQPAGNGHLVSGMVMIDDDLGMTGEALPPTTGLASSRLGGEPRQQGQQEEPPDEEFPSLSQAAAPDRGTNSGISTQPRARALPSLQKVTVKCACGRKVSHLALPQGVAAKALRCDAECERQQRSSRLADAFGIDDPSHHVPYVDRQRDAHYSPELLLYAWHNRSKVEALERQLADFVADSVKKRTSLAPMPKQQRHIAHLLAEQYGLASQSFGAEPNRYLQLFKAAHTAVPRQALSKVAQSTTLEDLERAVRAERGFPVHFTDVAPSVDLHRILERWEGQFVLSGPHADGSAAARFSRPEAAKQVMDALGGGVRGHYRINRAASTTTAAAPAAMPQAHAGSSVAGANRAGAPHQSASHRSSAPVMNSSALRAPAPRPTGLRSVDPGAIRASDMAFEESPVAAKKTAAHAKSRLPVQLQPSLAHMPTAASKQETALGLGSFADGQDDHVAESWEDTADDGE